MRGRTWTFILFFLVFCLHSFVAGVRHFHRAHSKWVLWFSAIFTLLCLLSHWSLFSSFVFRVQSSNSFSVWVSSSQSVLVPNSLLIHFFFQPGCQLLFWPRLGDLLPIHLPIHFSLRAFISLCDHLQPLSLIRPSFPPSCVWLLNPARKLLITKTITHHP